MTIILFAVILGILVFVHEWGHFLAARWAGVKVEEFGFGFPPRLFGLRRGSTIFSINWIPFGGFVRLYGEQGEGIGEPGSLSAASGWRQFGIMAAGVLMNYLLAWVLLTIVFVAGIRVETNSLSKQQLAKVTNPQVQSIVTSGGTADQAGLKTGDTIISINNQVFHTTQSLADFTRSHNFPTLDVRFKRQNEERQLSIKAKNVSDPQAAHYDMGLAETGTLRYRSVEAVWYGLRSTISLTSQTIVGLGKILQQLVSTGHLSADVSGPVGIAVLTGEISRLGIIPIFQFMAVLSVSLAVINFLPIPALDGGRAFLLILQRALRRRFNPKIEGYIHAAGFYILLLMILLISVRDVQRFGLWDRIQGLFS